jgi:NADH-quinone oxidoreductase subunit K
VPEAAVLILSALLFALGGYGAMARKNPLQMFMAIEMMWNAVNLVFIYFARQFGDVGGQIFVFVVVTVAAAEVAIGLGTVVLAFRGRERLDLDELDSLKG